MSLSVIDDLFTLHERGLTFLFLGECSILQEENSIGIRKINFEVGLRKTGTILGRLKLTLEQIHSLEKIKMYFSSIFNLDGQDEKTGLSISMENCFIRNWENSSNDNEVSGIFLASEVVLGKDNLTRTLSSMTKFHFGLTNVFRITDVNLPEGKVVFKNKDRTIAEWDLGDLNSIIITSPLGKLKFYNYPNLDENEKIMQNFKLPVITAAISIEFSENDHNLDLARKRVIEIVEDFLMVSSFIQTCRHDWKFVLVESEDNLRFISIRLTRNSIPFYFPLNNKMNSSIYNELWTILPLSKYKKNITLALDWYLESMVAEEIHPKFLNLSTALECLMDGYHKVNDSEFILTESEFSILEKKVIPEINMILNQLEKKEEKDRETFESIKNSFQQLRRRTYINKFKLLLHQLTIDYSDVKLNLRKIVNIRNDITHRGDLNYVNDEKKLNEIYEQYKAFWSVLIRIFLKLLNYSGNYFDPFHRSIYNI